MSISHRSRRALPLTSEGAAVAGIGGTVEQDVSIVEAELK